MYALQERTKAIARLLASLVPDRALNPWFLQILAEGTGKQFTPRDNAEWSRVTRPILEAFFHARFFLEMAVRYAYLDEPPRPLPSGYAALLFAESQIVATKFVLPKAAPSRMAYAKWAALSNLWRPQIGKQIA